MPGVPSGSTILALDAAAKPSVVCWVPVEGCPLALAGADTRCLFPGHPSLAIQRATLETEWLCLTLQFGKMLQSWPIGSRYNLPLCALGCGLPHFASPWMCALCVHHRDADS